MLRHDTLRRQCFCVVHAGHTMPVHSPGSHSDQQAVAASQHSSPSAPTFVYHTFKDATGQMATHVPRTAVNSPASPPHRAAVVQHASDDVAANTSHVVQPAHGAQMSQHERSQVCCITAQMAALSNKVPCQGRDV